VCGEVVKISYLASFFRDIPINPVRPLPKSQKVDVMGNKEMLATHSSVSPFGIM